ncbi:MAG: guanylate kinase [Gammaproteobacteria bacterium]|nr:guanylate kinase [Gammaproteobacteria bacterium]MCI0590705.1 guanylate kinase [Gammaproteobacteria bacterium]
MHKGKLYIISAPSGAGKTTLIRALLESTPELELSVSFTTRPKRPNERDGIDYHFIDEKEFERRIESGQFLEYAKVFDHYYGTSRAWVERELAQGSDVLLEIDWQGAQQVRKIIPDTVSIFILPPSYKALEGRLRQRGADDQDTITRRMRDAVSEVSHYHEYDYMVLNEKFETALEDLRAIVRASRLVG